MFGRDKQLLRASRINFFMQNPVLNTYCNEQQEHASRDSFILFRSQTHPIGKELRIRLAKNIYHASSCGPIRISRPGYLFVDCRYECGSILVISLRLTDKIVACIP